MRLHYLLPFIAVASLGAQTQQSKASYPAPPRGLPDDEEIALARTAAPAEVSSRADVYVMRGNEFVKARAGTNGCACMVARDLHEGSLYPICFDREGAQTSMRREMMEVTLRAKGRSEAEVKAAVAAAYATGELAMPRKASMAYMMSPRQVLFSSPNAEGVRVGAWWPHLMIVMPGVSPDQIGLMERSTVDVIQLNADRAGQSELVVKVPTWSDGRPAPPPR